MTTTPLVLHVWPGRWDLPSIDPYCLEAILFLQLAFPGYYSLVETADPDLSPCGQLPFLTHGQIVVSPLPSIISYLSTLDPSLLNPSDTQNDFEIDLNAINADLDGGLSTLQLSQRTAWRAYIEAQLGDLVVSLFELMPADWGQSSFAGSHPPLKTHSFFVLEPNYVSLTHGTLVSMLPVPQRYYVPRRIRESYRPRLEAVGLWQIANEPEDREEGQDVARHKRGNKDHKIRRAFGQAKLLEKARPVLDILSTLLSDKPFIFNDRVTSADLTLASRILLLVNAPFPNPALKDLITASYPTLNAHAARVHALTFPPSPSTSRPHPAILVPPRVSPLNVLKSTFSSLFRHAVSNPEESEEAKRFRRYRWGWIALAVAGAVGYVMTQGLPIVVVVSQKKGIHEGSEGSKEMEMGSDDDELVDEPAIDEENA